MIQTKKITIDGQELLVAYCKTDMGISLKKTTDAETGQAVWLNLSQQEQAKQQINYE